MITDAVTGQGLDDGMWHVPAIRPCLCHVRWQVEGIDHPITSVCGGSYFRLLVQGTYTVSFEAQDYVSKVACREGDELCHGRSPLSVLGLQTLNVVVPPFANPIASVVKDVVLDPLGGP